MNTISSKKVIKSGNDPESIRYLELQVSRLRDHFRINIKVSLGDRIYIFFKFVT